MERKERKGEEGMEEWEWSREAKGGRWGGLGALMLAGKLKSRFNPDFKLEKLRNTAANRAAE